jgi:hypothetical protein
MVLKSIFTIFSVLFISYTSIKNNINTSRKRVAQSYKNATNKSESLNQIRDKFTNHLVSDIIPQWYGTKWSFDGYSEIPKSGSIACGYFVSTTLRDVGLNINRYKLAQKAPYHEAEVIACGTTIETLQDKSKEELKAYFIKNKKDGLYFIGLDFHVGFILKEGQNIYFIHSNYINNSGPIKEKIDDSRVMKSSVYHFCNITHNDVLLKKWLNNEVVVTN